VFPLLLSCKQFTLNIGNVAIDAKDVIPVVE
jgi:hypothetical protein